MQPIIIAEAMDAGVIPVGDLLTLVALEGNIATADRA